MDIIVKVRSMSRQDLTTTWLALSQQQFGSTDMYDAEHNITMDDWANTVYGEMCRRQIPRSYQEPVM